MDTQLSLPKKNRLPLLGVVLFFAATSLACVLALFVFGAAIQQSNAVDQLVALSAEASDERDQSLPVLIYRHQHSKHAKNPEKVAWLREWFGDEYFGVLETLQLDNTPTRDEDLKLLAALPALSFLRLAHTEVTDEGMFELAQCHRLELLVLDDTDISDQGIAALSDLPNLRVLGLRGTRITDECIPALSRLKNLYDLTLRDTAITPRGYQRLSRNLPSCNIETPTPYSFETSAGTYRYNDTRRKMMLLRIFGEKKAAGL